jgi:hypothetical protein
MKQQMICQLAVVVLILGVGVMSVQAVRSEQNPIDYARDRVNQGVKEVVEADNMRDRVKAVQDCIRDICDRSTNYLKQQTDRVSPRNSQSSGSQYQQRNYNSSGSPRSTK